MEAEWIRDALVEEFPRIHIFQRSELGVDRIRQYLGRAEIPLLVLSFDAPADRLTGARNARELARRLKRQNPRMMILMIGEEGRMDSGDRAEGVVVRARSEQIRDPDAQAELEEMAASLRRAVVEWAAKLSKPA